MRVNIHSFGSGDAEAVRELHLKAFTGRENEARLVESLHAEDAGPVSLAAEDSSSGGMVGRKEGRGVESPALLHTLQSSPVALVAIERAGIKRNT